jgi:hypothetical protein
VSARRAQGAADHWVPSTPREMASTGRDDPTPGVDSQPLESGGASTTRTASVGWLLVLCSALALGTALRLVGIAGKRVLQGDEGVTYLAATAHQRAWALAGTTGLVGRWVPAARWQSYLGASGFWGFARIRLDLNSTDNHPPLYFWLLHVWVWLVGVRLWSGPLLNTGIAVATGVTLFLVARRVLGDRLQAAIVTLLWAVSAPAIATSMMARNYELLALFGVLFVFVAHRLVDGSVRPSWRDGAYLAAVTAGLLLTHYESVPFVFGVALVAAILVLRERRRLWLVLAGFVAGVLLALLLDPGFLQSFVRQRHQASAFIPREMVTRAGIVVSSLGSFFRYHAIGSPHLSRWSFQLGKVSGVIVVIGLLVAIGLFVGSPRVRAGSVRWARARSAGDWVVVAAVLLAAASTMGIYVAMQVPVYAMGARYLALFWPFLALVVVCLVRLLPRARLVVVVALVVAIVVPMAVQDAIAGYRGTRSLAPPAGVRAIVVDTTRRTVVPRALWSVPHGVSLFVDPEPRLIRDQSAWLGHLQAGDLFYDSVVFASAADSAAELAVLRSRFEIVRLPRSLIRGATFRILGPRRGGPAANGLGHPELAREPRAEPDERQR